MTPYDIGYYACSLDAEGSIVVTKPLSNYPQGLIHVNMSNTVESWIKRFQEDFGGTTYINNREGARNPASKPGHVWRAVGRTAEPFLRLVRPYLRIKGLRADLALLYIGTIPVKSTGKGTPQHVQDLREMIREEMNRLNKRGVEVCV